MASEKNKYYKNLRNEALKLFDEHGFIAQSTFSQNEYDLKISLIQRDVSEISTSPDDTRYLIACLRVRAKNIITENKLKVTLPKVPVKLVESHSFRTDAWFQRSQQIFVWKNAFVKVTDAVIEDNFTDTKALLALTLFSAIYNGGLYNIEHLKQLTSKLRTLDKPMKSLNRVSYIFFDQNIQTGNYNVQGENKTIRRKRWHPDTITLAFILKYLSSKKDRDLADFIDYQANDIYHLIDSILFFNLNHNTSLTSLSSIIQSAPYAATVYLEADLNEVLINCMLGGHDSLSISEESFHELFAVQKSTSKETTHLQFQSLNNAEEKQSLEEIPLTVFIKDLPELERFYRDLKNGINSGEKTQIVKDLNELKDEYSDLPRSIFLFTDWLSSRVFEIEISTLKNYFHALATIWLPEAFTLDLDRASSVDLLCFYDSILDRVIHEDTLNLKISLVKQIHSYGTKHYGLPRINDMGRLNTKSAGSKAFVRTDIVNHRNIKEATHAILSDDSLNGTEKSVALIIILAFRLGLRRGELLKIRIQDVEPEGEWQLSVVNNEYGKNKSRSSNRRIPIKPLLHCHEFEAFEVFFNHRHLEYKSDSLLFGYGSLNLRLADNYVSKVIGLLLRKVTGNNRVVMHSLRHSAANFMHAVIEGEFDLAQYISGFSPKKIKIIRETIVGKGKSKIALYWELAGFMGHASPKETLRSYLHLVDYIVYKKLIRTTIPLSDAALSKLTGMPQNNLNLKDREKIHRFMFNKNTDYYSTGLETPPRFYKSLYQYPGLKDQVIKPSNNDFNLLYKLLKNFQTGGSLCELSLVNEQNSIYELAADFAYDSALLANRIEKARELFSMRRGEAGSQLVEADILKNTISGREVTPRHPTILVCREEAFKRLTSLFKLPPKTIHAWANKVVNTSRVNNRGLHISKIKTLKDIMAPLISLYGKQRWWLDVYSESVSKRHKGNKEWLEAFPSKNIRFIKKPNKNYDIGQARLYLLREGWEASIKKHNKKSDVQYNKYSSDQLKFISQIVFIMT